MSGAIDIDIGISTAEDNAAKSQELSFLLQTVGPNEDPEIRRQIMAQIMDLMRMPEQAKEIRAYQPKPDPLAEKRMQLEIAKLDAEIKKINADTYAKYASAKEDEADKAEKSAKAALVQAQARKLHSESDNLDLKYISDDGQVGFRQKLQEDDMKHTQEMQKREHDRLANLDAMMFQAAHEDKNIGVTTHG